MKNNKRLLLLIMLLSFVFLAKANGGKSEAPILHGYVTDAVTKKPVAGVIVSAILAGNTNNAKEVTTDADGYFHFVQLPATQLTLQFDKKGYQPYKRSGVIVKEKATIKITVEFLPEDMDEDADNSEYPLLRMIQLY